MKVVNHQVETFQQRAYCETDGTELEAEGTQLPSYPPMYPHTCPKCKNTENLDHLYPRLVTREVK